MEPADRFTGMGEAYDTARPDYPSALVDWIVARCPRLRVVDVGCGTGILSRQLADAGLHVVGVDPNLDMRRAAQSRGGGPTYVEGDAEHTGLPDNAADLVVAAQAAHWFDLQRDLPELERVAGGGPVVAVWNLREDVAEGGGFNADYDALLREFSEAFRTVPRPGSTIARICAVRPQAEVVEVPHHQDLDAQGVIRRASSSSYVVHSVTDRAAFDAALHRVVAKHAVNGRVRIPYQTRWVWWSA